MKFAAGCPDDFLVEGDRLIKKGGTDEARAFQLILEDESPASAALRSMLPVVHSVDVESGCIEMENVIYNMAESCVIDIKIGYKLWRDDADPSKIERLHRAATTAITHGFRISGMTCDTPEGNVTLSKKCRDPDAIRAALGMPTVDENHFATEMFYYAFTRFVDPSRTLPVCEVVARLDRLRGALRPLRRFASQLNDRWVMRGSSVLFAYDPVDFSGSLQMRIIDLAHTIARPAAAVGESLADEGFALGVSNLACELAEIAERASSQG